MLFKNILSYKSLVCIQNSVSIIKANAVYGCGALELQELIITVYAIYV